MFPARRAQGAGLPFYSSLRTHPENCCIEDGNSENVGKVPGTGRTPCHRVPAIKSARHLVHQQ